MQVPIQIDYCACRPGTHTLSGDTPFQRCYNVVIQIYIEDVVVVAQRAG